MTVLNDEITFRLAPGSGRIFGWQWRGVDVFVGLGEKAWCTDDQKKKVRAAHICDALATAGWNEHHVARADVLWQKIANFHLSFA